MPSTPDRASVRFCKRSASLGNRHKRWRGSFAFSTAERDIAKRIELAVQRQAARYKRCSEAQHSRRCSGAGFVVHARCPPARRVRARPPSPPRARRSVPVHEAPTPPFFAARAPPRPTFFRSAASPILPPRCHLIALPGREKQAAVLPHAPPRERQRDRLEESQMSRQPYAASASVQRSRQRWQATEPSLFVVLLPEALSRHAIRAIAGERRLMPHRIFSAPSDTEPPKRHQ